MDLTPVACNHCGASLQVPPTARFVTCRYCNSQLEIKRTESTITTEVLQQINQNTASMAEDLHALRRETEIERLDREWNQTQAALLIKDKDGHVSTPTATGGIIGSVIMGGFGLFWTIIAFAITAPDSHFPPGFGPPPIIHIIFPLFGVLFIVGAIIMGIKTAAAASRFEEQKGQYQARRRQLLSQQSPNNDAASTQ
ncbi:MAG: hypothetical protein WCI73_13155 [Phycisphaerae bacterium]